MPADTTAFRTSAEVAELIGTSVDRIGDLIRAGDLRAIDIRAPGSRRATWIVTHPPFANHLSAEPISHLLSRRLPGSLGPNGN